VLVAEETKNFAVWTRGAWREQPQPAIFRELLADSLVGVPGASPGGGQFKTDLGEVLRSGEVGDLDVYLPGP